MTPAHRRRGTLYIAVLGTALLLTVIGLSAILTTGALRRSSQGDLNLAMARHHSIAAIELGLNISERSSNWRSGQGSGLWFTNRSLGQGSISLYVHDPVDGDLANAASDPVRFTGVGVVGDARYILETEYQPTIEALEALATSVHAGAAIQIKSGATLTVSGAPASTNGAATVDGTINGDVHANSVDQADNVNGTVRAPSDAKPMPDDVVFATFAGLATAISTRSVIQSLVLSRGVNPEGTPNSNGAYFIDTGGSNLSIRGIRLLGTLVISAPGAKVTIDQHVLMSADREDFPVLIVDGDLELAYASGGGAKLDESTWSTNFNPSGAPYANTTDADTNDSYPSGIQGLVYVTGNVLMSSTAEIDGVLICEGAFSCDGTNSIRYDDQSLQTPPEGFMQSGTLRLKLGTARRVLSLP